MLLLYGLSNENVTNKFLYSIPFILIIVLFGFGIWYLADRVGVTLSTDYTLIYNSFSYRKIKTNTILKFELNHQTRTALAITEERNFIIASLSPPIKKLNPKLYKCCEEEINNLNMALQKVKEKNEI